MLEEIKELFYKHKEMKNKHLHWYLHSLGWWMCLYLLLAGVREEMMEEKMKISIGMNICTSSW